MAGETTESDEHLFATDTGVYTTRTVKASRLGEKLAGNSVGQAGRPVGRPRRTALLAPSVPTLQWSRKVKDRVKMQVSAAVRTRKISILPEFLVQQSPRANRGHRHPDQRRPKMGGARDNTASDDCPQAPVPAPSNPMEQAAQVSIKRDVRTAELSDGDEQGGKFLQVEGDDNS